MFNYTSNNEIFNKYFGPTPGSINLQNPGNIFMENIIYFHSLLLCVICMIVVLVSWFLIRTLLFFGYPEFLFKNFHIHYARPLRIFLQYVDIIYYYLYIWISFLKKTMDWHINEYLIRSDIERIGYCKEFKHYAKPTINTNFSLYIYKLNKDQTNFFNPLITYYDYKTLEEYIKNFHLEYRYYFYSDVLVEFLWTLFPAVILGILAIPSFSLLFSIQRYNMPEMTLKIIGHQWYWEYQYVDYVKYNRIYKNLNENSYIKLTNKTNNNYILESYMIQDEDLSLGQLRLLEVDNKLVLPIETSIRLLITSDDVLHSWAVPSLGIKVDACPGRINELVINIREVGVFFGQCSELCGWYHGFMPIAIQTLKKEDFKYYVITQFLDVTLKIKK